MSKKSKRNLEKITLKEVFDRDLIPFGLPMILRTPNLRSQDLFEVNRVYLPKKVVAYVMGNKHIFYLNSSYSGVGVQTDQEGRPISCVASVQFYKNRKNPK